MKLIYMINKSLFFLILPLLLFHCSSPEQKVKETKPLPDKKQRLVIDEFEYIGPPQSKDMVAGIRSTLTNGLSRLPYYDVTSIADQKKASRLVAEKQKMGDDKESASTELAKIVAADLSCKGTIQVSNNNILVNVSILKAPAYNVINGSNVQGDIKHPFDLQKELVKNLLAGTDIAISESDSENIELNQTKNETAFAEYSKGSEILYTDPKKAAVHFANALSKDLEFTDALEDLSNALFQMGDYKKALNYMLKKKTILEKRNLQNSLDYSNTLCNIGIAYFALGDSKKALELCLEDKKLKEQIGQSKTKYYATTLQSIAGIYLGQDKKEEALQTYEKARTLYILLALEKTHDYADLLVSTGAAYKQKGDYQAANSYYDDAAEIYKELGLTKTSSYATLLSNRGNLLLAQKDYKSALKNFIADKDIQDKLNLTNTEEYATTLSNLGLIMSELGQIPKAKEFKAQAEKIRKSKK